MKTFKSQGVLSKSFVHGYGHRLVLTIDDEIVRYARSLVPKWMGMKTTRYAPHVSVVRHEIVDESKWNLVQESVVSFIYSSEAKLNDVYCWIDVWSDQLVEIRRGLGLSDSRKIVDGVGVFHVTIGNFKDG